MLLQQPKNKNDYIVVDEQMNIVLQKNNFSPSYFYKGNFYYLKESNILEFLKERRFYS